MMKEHLPEFPCACAANRLQYDTCAPNSLYRQSTLDDHDRSFLGVAEDSSGNSDSLEKENELTAPEMAISLAEFLKPSNQQEPMSGHSSKNVTTQSTAPQKSVIDEQFVVYNELEPPKTTNYCAPSKPH